MRRTFKEYEAMWEDAAANSVGGGGVSMPADMMPKAAHKKHKKRVYDGRTKEGKAFIRRILDKRNKKMLKGQKEIDEGRYNSRTDTYEFDENDFRYYRTGELKLKNGAYGRDVEKAFKKAGYDVYGGDVRIRRDEIRFNQYSKKWGTSDKKLRQHVLDVLNVDINKL
jgi:hypothetical protein